MRFDKFSFVSTMSTLSAHRTFLTMAMLCLFVLVISVQLSTCFVAKFDDSISNSKCQEESCKQKELNADFDYLLFVVQWPESFCLYYNASHSLDKNAVSTCVIPSSIQNWTIHGTWPTSNGSTKPDFCNSSWPFDPSKISDLVPQLNQLWPNLLTGVSPDSLWSHEWGKHGTCAASVAALNGEHNYFGGTLKLRQTYNIDSILADSGIVPSPTALYTLSNITDAIKKATGSLTQLVCYQKFVNSQLQQDLAEIHLCLEKTLTPFDCKNFASTKTALNNVYYNPCSSKTGIKIPPIS